jgi:hypothetical protein
MICAMSGSGCARTLRLLEISESMPPINRSCFRDNPATSLYAPKTSSLELCIFVGRSLKTPQVRRVERMSKSKLAHFIRITHRDEVEALIMHWRREAYEFSDEPLTGDRVERPSKPEKGLP